MSKPANHILVDANIAQSASARSGHSVSMKCMSLARELSDKNGLTGMATTPALVDEWKRHASPTMVSWFASMESRGRVRREQDRPVRDLREMVSDQRDENIIAAMLKDIHLSEAAILNGLPIASQDDRQRSFLKRVSNAYALAANIQWLNPVTETGDWLAWIKDGCTDRLAFCCSAPDHEG